MIFDRPHDILSQMWLRLFPCNFHAPKSRRTMETARLQKVWRQVFHDRNGEPEGLGHLTMTQSNDSTMQRLQRASTIFLRGAAVVAGVSHKHNVAGSNPAPASIFCRRVSFSSKQRPARAVPGRPIPGIQFHFSANAWWRRLIPCTSTHLAGPSGLAFFHCAPGAHLNESAMMRI